MFFDCYPTLAKFFADYIVDTGELFSVSARRLFRDGAVVLVEGYSARCECMPRVLVAVAEDAFTSSGWTIENL